jgi:hypothetical protein
MQITSISIRHMLPSIVSRRPSIVPTQPSVVSRRLFAAPTRAAAAWVIQRGRNTCEDYFDELELYDIFKKPKMTQAEEIKVKNAAKRLLHRLKEEEPRKE